MTKPVNAPRPKTDESRAKPLALGLRRLIVWSEILDKPVSRRAPRFPRYK